MKPHPATSRDSSSPDWLGRLQAMERGDQRAMLEVSHVIHGFLARHGGARLHDHWADISQEVIVKLLKAVRRKQIREPRAVIAFIGVVTRNELATYMRRRQKGPILELPADSTEHETAAVPSMAWAGAPRWDHDLLIDAERALASLPEKTQAVLRSIYHQGHSYEETALALGLPVGTVNRTRTEGMRELRRLLGLEA